MIPSLFDLDLDQLRDRVVELEEWGRVLESGDEEFVESLRATVFALGGTEEETGTTITASATSLTAERLRSLTSVNRP